MVATTAGKTAAETAVVKVVMTADEWAMMKVDV